MIQRIKRLRKTLIISTLVLICLVQIMTILKTPINEDIKLNSNQRLPREFFVYEDYDDDDSKDVKLIEDYVSHIPDEHAEDPFNDLQKLITELVNNTVAQKVIHPSWMEKDKMKDNPSVGKLKGIKIK